jgi:hypothetical protein
MFLAILGIVLAVGAQMLLGFLWYGPWFGKRWMQLVGMTPEMMASSKDRAKNSYIFMTLTASVTALVMYMFLTAFATTLLSALSFALLAWLGFVATTNMHEYLFSVKQKPWELYVLNVGYMLASFLTIAAIMYFFL